MIAPRSLRWRLQLWYGLFLAAVLAAFGFTAVQFERGRQLRELDQQLEDRASLLARSLRPEANAASQPDRREPPPPADLPPPPEGDEDEPPPAAAAPHPQARPHPRRAPVLHLDSTQASEFGAATGFYYVIGLRNGPGSHSAGAPAEPPGPFTPGLRTRGGFRETVQPLAPGDFVIVGHSLAAASAELRGSAWRLAAAGFLILAAGFLGGAWFTRRALAPLDRMGAAAAEFAAGDLARRVPLHDAASEFQALADVLNATFDRLARAFAQQARFTADAAHELRTPVAVILTQAQIGLEAPGLAPEARAAFAACQRSAQRMRKLIESLLELARWDAGREELRRSPCDLGILAQNEIEHLQPWAAQSGVTLRHEGGGAPCSADADRVTRILTNLLTNAVQHSPAGGLVIVRTGTAPGTAIVEVQDQGKGVPEEHLPHLFDRFYQADPSRSQGRSGLGLSISQTIAQAHGGSLTAANRREGGAIFRLKLPA